MIGEHPIFENYTLILQYVHNASVLSSLEVFIYDDEESEHKFL